MTTSSQPPANKPEDSLALCKTVATPEGDNEFAPDQPLKPILQGQQKPPAIDTNKL
jgi:hypothetical protein